MTETDTSRSDTAYQVGDTADLSDIRITYDACEPWTSDNQFIQPAEGNEYYKCTFTFENTGDSDQFVSAFDFNAYADGVSVDQSYASDNMLSATISSGRKASGDVIIEVPADATVVELEYAANYWTSDRVVFTVK